MRNTEPRSSGGEHWFAVGPSGGVYDSLKPNGALCDTEQTDWEKNCGQRALAWCCLHAHDPKLAWLL